MRITKKQLAIYLGKHYTRVKNDYQLYLDLLMTKRKYLTVFDIAKIDDLKPETVAELMQFSPYDIKKLSKIKHY